MVFVSWCSLSGWYSPGGPSTESGHYAGDAANLNWCISLIISADFQVLIVTWGTVSTPGAVEPTVASGVLMVPPTYVQPTWCSYLELAKCVLTVRTYYSTRSSTGIPEVYIRASGDAMRERRNRLI